MASRPRSYGGAAGLALSLASGFLFAASFPPVQRSWLVWISLAPLVAATTLSASWRAICVSSHIAGSLATMLATDWMVSAAATVDSPPRTISWLILSQVGGLQWSGSIAITHPLARRGASIPLAFACSWASVRWAIAAAGIVLVDWPAHSLDVALPAADDLPLLQVAEIGGMALVGWVVCYVNAVVGCFAGRLLREDGRAVLAPGAAFDTAVALALVLISMGFGHYRLSNVAHEEGPTVALVPASLDPAALVSEGKGDSEGGGAREAAEEGADIYLWPECAVPLRHGSDSSLATSDAAARLLEFAAIARTRQAALAVACIRVAEGPQGAERRNSVLWITADGALAGEYDKRFLVPLRERRPGAQRGSTTSGFSPGTASRAFPTGPFRAAGSHLAGIAICYDVFFTEPFHDIDSMPDFFLLSSDESSDPDLGLARICLWATSFRAVETRRAIARNATTGFSGIVDPLGRFEGGLNLNRPDDLRKCRIPIERSATLYGRLGEWVTVASASWLVFSCIRSRNQFD